MIALWMVVAQLRDHPFVGRYCPHQVSQVLNKTPVKYDKYTAHQPYTNIKTRFFTVVIL